MQTAFWQEKDCPCFKQGPTSSPKRRPTPKEMPKPYTLCRRQQKGQLGTGKKTAASDQLRSEHKQQHVAGHGRLDAQAKVPAVAEKQATVCATLQRQYCQLLNSACCGTVRPAFLSVWWPHLSGASAARQSPAALALAHSCPALP